MFISNEAIKASLENLEKLHPFFGITFLACKKNKLPIGKLVDFSITSFETELLNKFYKPVVNTEKYFRVFRTSEKDKYWLNNDYASSGSQATRTQMFNEAFIHKKNTSDWGWNLNYINILSTHLVKSKISSLYDGPRLQDRYCRKLR